MRLLHFTTTQQLKYAEATQSLNDDIDVKQYRGGAGRKKRDAELRVNETMLSHSMHDEK